MSSMLLLYFCRQQQHQEIIHTERPFNIIFYDLLHGFFPIFITNKRNTMYASLNENIRKD